MKRRTFVAGLGAAAAWPLAARGQTIPIIGVLEGGTSDGAGNLVPLRQGLRDTGYVEGRNLKIEYRFADNHYDRLPGLAADLVRRKVAVIFATGGGLAPPAAKAATSTIPIVFTGGFDPVLSGLVASLARPGGNVTGASFSNNVLEAKRLGLLHTVAPQATTIAVLINPGNASADDQQRDLGQAAHTLGLKLEVALARDVAGFEPAFASFTEQGAGALVVATDVLFSRQYTRLIELAARHALPAIYPPFIEPRDAAAAGGLMSYGASLSDAFRQAGVYVGRILHGEKPADLPVVLPTRFQLVINLKTAKALGVTVPEGLLLAAADEVIE
jgi:putative ABC transport system substrate-binding protein